MTMNGNIEYFDNVLKSMKDHKMKMPADRIQIRISGARKILFNAMKYFVGMEGKEFVWLPEYDQVALWLENNEGKGLFLYGNCGRGKSILGRFALPAILLKYCGKVVSVCDMQEMNKNLDAVLKKHIISLDDVGTEELSVKYGDRRMAFAEIIDAAEKETKLLLVSSNLDDIGIKERYGDRILDRVRSTTKRILFTGDSLRC